MKSLLPLCAFVWVSFDGAIALASPAAEHGAQNPGGLRTFFTADFWIHWPSKEDGRVGYVWMLINFALLMLVLDRLLFRNLRSSNAEKSDHIKLELDRASEARAKAESLQADFEVRLGALGGEIADIKAKAAELAHAEGEQIIADAKEDADKIRRSASEQAEREGRRRQTEIEAEVVERALAKAEDIIKSSFGAADQARLVDAYVKQVGDAELGERKAS